MKNFGFDNLKWNFRTGIRRIRKIPRKPEDWQHASDSLARTMARLNIPIKNGGRRRVLRPKIDIKLIDAIGRRATDYGAIRFQLPARFGLEYVGEDGARTTADGASRAAGIGRKIFWNFDRALCGCVSAVAAPVQVQICPVSEKFRTMQNIFTDAEESWAAGASGRPERKAAAKIRDAQLQKIPYMLVVGPKEAEAGTVSVRHGRRAIWVRGTRGTGGSTAEEVSERTI